VAASPVTGAAGCRRRSPSRRRRTADPETPPPCAAGAHEAQDHPVEVHDVDRGAVGSALLDSAVVDAQPLAPRDELGQVLAPADGEDHDVQTGQVRLAGAELPGP
jgi:hypothetical protein